MTSKAPPLAIALEMASPDDCEHDLYSYKCLLDLLDALAADARSVLGLEE